MSDHNLAEALRPLFEKAFMSYYTNGAHLLERFDTGHYRGQEAQAAWRIAREFGKALAAHEAEQQAGEAVGVVRHGNIKPGIPWTDVRWLRTPPPNGTKLFTHPQQPLTECGPYQSPTPQ